MSFFEEERRLGGEIAAGPPTTMTEIADAAIKSQWYVDNVNARNVASEEAFDRRIDDIFRTTGIRLDSPLRERVARSEVLADRPVRFAPPGAGRLTAETAESFEQREQGFLKRLDELAEQFPEAAHMIKPGRSPMEDAREKARTSEGSVRDVMARYRGLPGSGTLAQFAGGFVGMLNDPVNVATMALGPTGRAGAGLRGLGWMAAKQGAANAAVEGASQPWIAAWRADAGVGYDASTFWGNVGTAFAFGFGVDAAFRGAIRGVQGARGREAVLDPDGGIMGWRRPGEPDAVRDFGLDVANETGDEFARDVTWRVTKGDKPTGVELRGRLEAGTMHLDFQGKPADELQPQVVMALARQIADRFPGVERFTGTAGGGLELGRLVGRAMDDDVAAIRELAKRTGADTDERTKVLLDMMDDIEATSGRAPGLDPHLSDWAEAQAARHVTDPREPQPAAVPQRPMVLYRGEGPADPLRRQNRGGEWYTTDLERALSYAGDRADRRGVFRIEVAPDRIGELKRGLTGDEYMVPTDLDRGRAAVTPETVAARHALASGDLDVLGMAALMRERPEALDASVPLSFEMARQAEAISRLSDAAFDTVMRGEASPEWGALVSRLVDDDLRHASILAELERLGPANAREARVAIGTLLQEAQPTARAFEGIDDVHGPEGQRQIEQLERQLGLAAAEEADAPAVRAMLDEAAMADVRAGKVPEQWAEFSLPEIRRRLLAGEDVEFPPEHFAAQKAIVEDRFIERLPQNADVGLLVAVRQGGVTGDGKQLYEPVFRLLDGREATLVLPGRDLTYEYIFRSHALFVESHQIFPEFGFSNAGLLSLSLPGERVLEHGLVGKLDHELWHAIISSQLLDRERLIRLWRHSEALGVLDMSLNDFFGKIEIARRHGNDTTGRTLRQSYGVLYSDLTAKDKARLLGEEAVTTFMQLYRAGHWTPEQLAPVKDIIDDFEAGKLGGRGKPQAASPAAIQPEGLQSPGEARVVDVWQGGTVDLSRPGQMQVTAGDAVATIEVAGRQARIVTLDLTRNPTRERLSGTFDAADRPDVAVTPGAGEPRRVSVGPQALSAILSGERTSIVRARFAKLDDVVSFDGDPNRFRVARITQTDMTAPGGRGEKLVETHFVPLDLSATGVLPSSGERGRGAPRIFWKGATLRQLHGEAAALEGRRRAGAKIEIGSLENATVTAETRGGGIAQGQGDAVWLLRVLTGEADRQGVRLAVDLVGAGDSKFRGELYRMYGFTGEGRLERRPTLDFGKGPRRPVPEGRVAHPDFPHVHLPVTAEGTVRFWRGEPEGQAKGKYTERIFTTNRDKAAAFAGPTGKVHEVVLPAARLSEAVPRFSSSDQVRVQSAQDVFVLTERAATGREPEPPRAMAETAGPRLPSALELDGLKAAPDVELRRNLDEAAEIARLADVIRECKL
jgi:hypothetical protein